jgi:hypothetical protein
MVERAVTLLKFLGQCKQLATSDIDMMWECAISPSAEISQATMSALRLISQYLDSTVLSHLFSKLESVKPKDFTDALVDLTAVVAHSKDKDSQPTSFASLRLLMMLTSDGVDVTPELAKTCREKLTTLLTKQHHPLLALSRGPFIEQCIQNLLEHKSVPVSLDLLRNIVLTYPEKADEDARWQVSCCIALNVAEVAQCLQVITSLEDKFSMLDALLKDLSAFKTSAQQQIAELEIPPEEIATTIMTGSGHRGFVAAVQARFDFLTFLLSNSVLKLNKVHIDQLWDVLIERTVCEAEAELFFKWCRSACDSTQLYIFDIEVALYIFDNKLANMKPETLNDAAYKCLQQYFLLSNKVQGKMESTGKHAFNYEVLDPELHGLGCIWRVALPFMLMHCCLRSLFADRPLSD